MKRLQHIVWTKILLRLAIVIDNFLSIDFLRPRQTASKPAHDSRTIWGLFMRFSAHYV
jgi:hypothetical protein